MTNLPNLQAAPKERGFVQFLFFGVIAGTLAVATVVVLIFWHFSRDLPKIITVEDYHPPVVTRVYANPLALSQAENVQAASASAKGTAEAPDQATATGKGDTLIAEFFKERRYLTPYDKIPDIVVRAFISAEDDQFFEHPGINIASIIRASIANFRAGHTVQGGSTITQQVAKSLLLTPEGTIAERTFSRKIKEVILASRLEKALTKQQILYLYLNQIYLGHGAYGVQAACETYFRKDISNISIAEAALLAGMPQAPGKYSPLLNPKRAKERQLYVLRRLYENKYITQDQMTEAGQKQLKIYHDEDVNTQVAPYLVEHIRRYLVDKYGEKAVLEDGLTVRVPTSVELAKAAQKSLKDGLRTVDKRIGYRGALQHLSATDDVEKFLKDYRIDLIEKRVQYKVLQPDGKIDAIEAMHEAGFESDEQLLQTGEVYQAVVTSFDEKHRSAGVMIGGIRADLPPSDASKWSTPIIPTKAFKRGDVILVRAESINGEHVVVSVDQDPQLQGAIFSMDVHTGAVLAMEGGFDYDTSEFNRAVQAQRQPGSSFKPIVYAAALEKGYTPASILVDSPIVYQDADSKWKPANFEEKFYGDTTFRQALIKSRNVPTIKIVQNIGVPYVIDYAKRLGFNGSFNADLSIALGSNAVSLMDITKVYALFPRLGRKLNPIFLSQVSDRTGKVLEENQPAPVVAPHVASAPSPGPSGAAAPAVTTQASSATGLMPVSIPSYPPADDPDQVLDPRVAYVMTNLMAEVVAYGTGHDAKALGRAAAGKTGTTSDCIDAWFMGFTPNVVTGVWVGFDNLKSIGHNETGARAALPIWLSYMKEAVKNYPDTEFTTPPGVTFASIDAQTGKLAPANSSRAIKEVFIEGTEPHEMGDANEGTSTETPGDFFKEDTE
jgi:penicillin-binding protein 1A